MEDALQRGERMSKNIVYDIQNLTKQYPGQTQLANKNITLQIYQGEIFGILGDNGAGKSTLVRQMVNVVRSTSRGYHTLSLALLFVFGQVAFRVSQSSEGEREGNEERQHTNHCIDQCHVLCLLDSKSSQETSQRNG